MSRRWIVIVALFSVALSIAFYDLYVWRMYVANKTYVAALDAHKDGRHDEALPVIREAAQAGDLDAMTILSTMYLRGQGTVADAQAAERWARRAAEAGKADAQFVLGWMYTQGVGVVVNREEGLKWLRAAATQGDRQALQLLEMLLEHSELSRS
jgi:uncharacterized protein